MGNQKIKRNSEITPHYSGGYISRSKLIDGSFVQREKINFPSNELFLGKIEDIKKATSVPHNISATAYDLLIQKHDAKFEIYTVSGTEIAAVIPCTFEQSMDLL